MHWRQTRWPILVAIAAMSLVFWAATARSSVVVDGVRYHYLDDDQMISMRYARNLASGLGPVWNAGERVEGYTNFGWMLVMAAVHAAGARDATASWWVQWIGWALACVVVLLSARLLADLGVRGWLALAALVPLALAHDLLYWAVNGFETTLLTATFLWALVRAVEERTEGVRSATFLIAGLLPVIRADAFDLTAAVLLVALVLRPRPVPWRAALVAVPILAHEVFRIAYYGDWLPNTYYLKVAGRSGLWLGGLGYAKGFGEAYAAAAVLSVVAFVYTQSRVVRVLAMLPVAGLARVAQTGPDIFDHYRFLAPYLPVMLVVAAAGIDEVTANVARARSAMAALLALSTIAASGVQGRTRVADLVSLNGAPATTTVVGVLLARHARPESSVAVLAAGCIGYFSRLAAIDLLGKSDRHIARLPVQGRNPTGHNRFDFTWSLARKPDFVSIFTPASEVAAVERDAMSPDYDREREGWGTTLLLNPAFTASYRDHPVPLRFLMRRSAVYVREGSPELARLGQWRDPEVVTP